MRKEVYFFLLISLTTLLIEVNAQENKFIKIGGEIFSKDSIPIGYVNITTIRDRSIGTYSDSSGNFELIIPSYLRQDTLVFSCIGYEDLKLALPIKSSTLKIALTSKQYILPEVIISTDTALFIVRKAVECLKHNLGDQKNILQGFYREVIRSNATYDRLTEAAVDVFDTGYKPFLGNENLQFRVRELRKSEDYMDLDWKASIFNYLYPKNGLHGTSNEAIFFNDYIRNNHVRFSPLTSAPLNEQFYEYVKFSLDSVLHYDGYNLLCIGIHQNPDKDERVPSGKIYIRSTDYAIFQMEYAISVNDSYKSSILSTPGEKFLHHTLIKYQEYEGKMYLSMLYRKAFRTQMNLTKFNNKENRKDGLFFDEKLFVVNEIITEKSKLNKFRKKEQQKKSIDLYSEKWEYNEDFWNTYNVVTDHPLKPTVQKNLERELSLKKQFIKND